MAKERYTIADWEAWPDKPGFATDVKEFYRDLL